MTVGDASSTAVEDEIKEDENVEDMTNEDAAVEQDESEEEDEGEDAVEESSDTADPRPTQNCVGTTKQCKRQNNFSFLCFCHHLCFSILLAKQMLMNEFQYH